MTGIIKKEKKGGLRFHQNKKLLLYPFYKHDMLLIEKYV